MSPVAQPRPHIITAERKPQLHSGLSSKCRNVILTLLRAMLVWRVCGEILPKLVCMRATWNAVQKMKNRMSTNYYTCNFTGVSFYTSRAINVYTDYNMRNITNEIKNLSLFLAYFLQNFLFMFVSTNQQHINFQNCFGVLCRLCQRMC